MIDKENNPSILRPTESIAAIVQLNEGPSVERRSKLRSSLVHAVRVAVLGAIIWMARLEHQDSLRHRNNPTATPLNLALVQQSLPNADSITKFDPSRDGQTVLDVDQQQIGIAIQTSPLSDSIVGYSGATNSLILFDAEEKIIKCEVLSSNDTHEHVEIIRANQHFLTDLIGRSWQQASTTPVDAVSGATLTSLAIEESIHRRLGGNQPSLRFPQPITIAELQPYFSSVTKISPRWSFPKIFDLFDDQNEFIGSFIRTSPSADTINGYQGPSDALVLFDRAGLALRSVLRSSFDNDQPEPFVRYVQEDRKFSRLVKDLSLAQIAKENTAQVEGVSGATMTSQGVMAAIQVAAAQAKLPQSKSVRLRVQWSWRDAGTMVVLTIALLLCFTRLNANRWFRYCFQVFLVVYFGFLNGDLLSQALVAGWAQAGVPWRHALGLALLAMAALLVPVFTRRNLYCHHICPFGAAQGLIRVRFKPTRSIPKPVAGYLKAIPALLLVVVFGAVFWEVPVNLAAIEPFDAFSIRVAGLATIGIAIIGLVASFFVPMAYCKYGCPTGGLLEFLRRNRRSDRWGKRDWLAVMLLAVAIAIRLN